MNRNGVRWLVMGLCCSLPVKPAWADGGVTRESNSQVLERVWAVGRANGCSPTMRARFDDETLHRLTSRLTSPSDREALSRVLNPFLFSLGYSHTQFFTERDEAYAFFKSHSFGAEPVPAAYLVVNPGVQVGVDDHGYFAREVLDGSPAKLGGLLKGDRLLTVDEVAFDGTWGPQPKGQVVVRVARRGEFKRLEFALPSLHWAEAFAQATLQSTAILTSGARRYGYVRLWSGVHPKSAEALWAAVGRFNKANVDGVVLDLRGGYGGALWPHLDPFFADRKGYFELSATDGDLKTTVLKPPAKKNPGAFVGPMVVLINEGSRSGKEALAYQFKKSKRATVVGTGTPGYFSGGQLFFGDEPTDYVLFMCVRANSLLDGHEVEGLGIRPDLNVEFEAVGPFADTQLAAALTTLDARQ